MTLKTREGGEDAKAISCYQGSMRRLAIFLVPLVAGCAAPEPAAVPGQAAETAGLLAGPPQSCVTIHPTDTMRVSETDRHTLIFGKGGTVFANRLAPGCVFPANDVLLTEPNGPSYCRGDIVRSFDPVSKIPGPSCALNEFVPYTRD